MKLKIFWNSILKRVSMNFSLKPLKGILDSFIKILPHKNDF